MTLLSLLVRTTRRQDEHAGRAEAEFHCQRGLGYRTVRKRQSASCSGLPNRDVRDCHVREIRHRRSWLCQFTEVKLQRRSKVDVARIQDSKSLHETASHCPRVYTSWPDGMTQMKINRRHVCRGCRSNTIPNPTGRARAHTEAGTKEKLVVTPTPAAQRLNKHHHQLERSPGRSPKIRVRSNIPGSNSCAQNLQHRAGNWYRPTCKQRA